MTNKSLISNLSYTSMGMILYNMSLWVLGMLVLKILGPGMSGYYGVAMSVGASLYGVALWGLRGFIISENTRFSYADYLYVRLMTIIISIVLMVVYLAISSYNFTQEVIIILYSLFKFNEAIIELFDCINQKRLMMDINAKSMMMRSFLLTLSFFACLYIFKSLIVGLIAINIITLGVFVFYNFKKSEKFKLDFNKKNIIEVLKLTFPIMGFEFLSALSVTIPRLRYEKLGDIEMLGIYVSIYTLVVFLQLAIQIFIVSIAPYMASDYRNKDTKAFLKKLAGLFLVALSLGLISEILVYFMGNFVIGLIYGENIGPYYTYLYWAIISGTSLGITWIFSQLFIILKKNKEQLLCSFISLLICIALSFTTLNKNDLNSISKILVLVNLSFIILATGILFIDLKKERKIS